MATSARIYIGITAATGPVLLPGSRFSNRTYGLDDGKRTYLVHPDCAASKWPQVSAKDKENTGMYVVDVSDSDDASGLVQLDVSLKGIAGKKPNRVTPDCDEQMLTIPVLQGGSSAKLLLPVPQPTATNEYVATVPPTLTGVGQPLGNAAWLPSPPQLERLLRARRLAAADLQLLHQPVGAPEPHVAGDHPGQAVVRAGKGGLQLRHRHGVNPSISP